MGTSASVTKNRDLSVKCGYQISSDAAETCETCKCDVDNVTFCTDCDKHLCSACCEHLAAAEKKKQNPFFGQVPTLVETNVSCLTNASSKAVYQKVKCGTLAWNGKLMLLCQLFYEDEHCTCCDKTSKWKLCYTDKTKPICLTRRIHKDEEFIHPGDICYSKEKRKSYLTLPCKQMVYKLSSGNTLHEAFSTPLGSCFGIASFNKGLAVSIRISTTFAVSKWQIHLNDYKGNVKVRIHRDTEGKSMFLEPLFLTSNNQEDILFVSDHEKHSVSALTATGDIIFECTDVNLKCPLGICVDIYNNVYVACGKKVIQIEKGGTDCEEILCVTSEETIVGICYDYNTHNLITISDWGNITKFAFRSDIYK